MESDQGPWAEFVVDGGAKDGIDASALASLLSSLARAARCVAADLLHRPVSAGRIGNQERDIAKILVSGISNSSVHIQLSAPKLGSGVQLELEGGDLNSVTADEVMETLQSDLASTSPVPGMSKERRAAVADVLHNSRRLGNELRMTSKQSRAKGHSFTTVQLSNRVDKGKQANSSGVLFGVTYMVDVEPGKARLRLRTFEGESFRCDVPSALIRRLPPIVGKPIEVRFEQKAASRGVPRNVARSLRLLDESEVGAYPVPKRWRQLAAQHRIDFDCIPEETDLIRACFESEDEMDQFREFLQQMRQAN